MKFFARVSFRGASPRYRLKSLILTLFSLLLAAATVFSACEKNAGDRKDFTAFKNTAVIVQSYDKRISATAEEKISRLLKDLNDEFSATVTDSTVYKINSCRAGEETEISERFKFIASECEKMYDFTGGRFDPSVYPLTLLWQFAPSYPVANFTPPTAESIAEILNFIGYNKFIIGDAAKKTDDNLKLDFGGALKGYLADKIAEILKAEGIARGYINVGGSSLYLISTDNLSVVHPRKDGYIMKIKITATDLSVSTSGDYEKTYTDKDGTVYSHIIDPFTGYPAKSGVTSATVIGKNGLLLDALTTAICLYPHDFNSPEKGELYKFIVKVLKSENFSGAQVFVACDNGSEKQILTNKKQDEDFDLFDSSYKIVTVTA